MEGHTSVGGMGSIVCNAMSEEEVDALLAWMQ